MLKKISILCLGCLVFLAFCGCEKKESINPNISVSVHLLPNSETKEIFNSMIAICKEYGKVEVIPQGELFKNYIQNEIVIDITISQLSEGKLPNPGKNLPVKKVSLCFMDYASKGENPNSRDEYEYIAMQDPAETAKKEIIAFKELMSDFVEYYRRQHSNASVPVFVIEEPIALEFIQKEQQQSGHSS